MHVTTVLPALPVALPLLMAGAMAGLRQWLSRAVADSLSIVAAALNLLVCCVLLSQSLEHTIVYWFGGWYPRGQQVIGICFVIDPAAAGIAALASFLTLCALVFSWRFVDAGGNHYHPLMLVFLAAMCGFASTGDLFNMFVFFELMSTAAFALCGLKTKEPAPLQGAFNFAITNTIAAFMVLTGIGLLYAVTGALNLAQIGARLGARHDALVLFAATLLTCGFLIKAAIVPFHFWLPDAHSVAPTPVCVLFSGIMVELGLYAILRLHSVVFAEAFASRAGSLRTILLAFGVLTVVTGGVMCYAEHHLKRMLAFSTISHAGLMLTALAVHTPVALAGMLLYLLAHALVKSNLFLCSGIVLHRLRTVSEPKLFACGRPLRFTAVLWFLGAIGLAGAPPFATMFGDLLTARGAEAFGLGWLPLAFFVGGVLTAGAVLRAGMRIFFGWGDDAITDSAARVDELPETEEGDTTIFPYHFVPAALCILLAAAISFLPAVRTDALLASTRIADQGAYIRTVYTGLTEGAQPPAVQVLEWGKAVVHGWGAAIFGLLLALTSVFRRRLPRSLRAGAYLEGPMTLARALQSGHPGDYVMWLTVGAACVGGLFLVFLR